METMRGGERRQAFPCVGFGEFSPPFVGQMATPICSAEFGAVRIGKDSPFQRGADLPARAFSLFVPLASQRLVVSKGLRIRFG
jgi:hypothetical protein